MENNFIGIGDTVKHKEFDSLIYLTGRVDGTELNIGTYQLKDGSFARYEFHTDEIEPASLDYIARIKKRNQEGE